MGRGPFDQQEVVPHNQFIKAISLLTNNSTFIDSGAPMIGDEGRVFLCLRKTQVRFWCPQFELRKYNERYLILGYE